jgi:GTP-binding protein HflX
MTDREISGNTQSLKASILAELTGLYDIEPDSGSFLPEQLLSGLAAVSSSINREIAAYINRKGVVLDISIGDSSTVTLTSVEGRRSSARLSGIRCVHTHPNGDPTLSAVDINSLLVLNMDAMVAAGIRNGAVCGITAALPAAGPQDGGRPGGDNMPGGTVDSTGRSADFFGPFRSCSEMDFLLELIYEREKAFLKQSGDSGIDGERAVLVGLELARERQGASKDEAERSLDELGELAATAGLIVLDAVLQRRPARDAAFFAGRGKIEELCLRLQALGADTLVFDDELSGAQIRNIEALTGAKVLDRTMLILDIFAQRARSKEGKLQVELAQLKYRLPRLTGLGGQLSRLGGGIGTRGPGEKKLETDRRHIRRRVSVLEEELDNIARRRELTRESRRRNSTPVVALVGYTNSGKSTLMNRLCSSDVLVEDKLFATLDPTARKLLLPNGMEIILVDTVGFIRKLPHELIEAFKSTLEEAVSADLLLHVVDVSDEEAAVHVKVAENILLSLGAAGKPVLMLLNKLDKAAGSERAAALHYNGNTLEISALNGTGIEALLTAMAETLVPDEEELLMQIPYSAGWVMPYLHENGSVLAQEYTSDGVSVKAKLKRSKVERIREYVVT